MTKQTLLSIFGDDTFVQCANGNRKSMSYYHKSHTRYIDAHNRFGSNVHQLMHHKSHQPLY